MNASKKIYIALLGLMTTATLCAQEVTDSVQTTSREGSNRDMLMNAASASQP